jgi:ubiquinone biosynthesis protein
MEFIEGVSLGSLLVKKKITFDKKKISHKIINCFFKQILTYGFFHADPHPGNIFIIKNKNICLLDFGSTELIEDELKNQLAEFVISVLNQDIDGITNNILEITSIEGDLDRNALREKIEDIVSEVYAKPLKRSILEN